MVEEASVTDWEVTEQPTSQREGVIGLCIHKRQKLHIIEVMLTYIHATCHNAFIVQWGELEEQDVHAGSGS